MERLIRPFDLRDLFTVRDLQRVGVILDLESSLLARHMCLRSAMTAYLFPRAVRVQTCMLESGGRRRGERGFIQLRHKAEVPEWIIIGLSPGLSEGTHAGAIWHQLLAGVLSVASEQGVLRVYANSMNDDDTERALGREGFTVYARERILRSAKGLAETSELSHNWRHMQDNDWPQLRSLYRSVTPHLVLQAEGPYPGGDRRLPSGGSDCLDEEGYVRERDGGLVAYVGLRRGSNGCWVRMFVSEDGCCPCESVSEGLRLIANRASQPLYCAVRAYHGDLERALCAAGLEVIAERSLMVRHTASRVAVGNRQLVRGLEQGVHARRGVSPCSRGPDSAGSLDSIEVRSIN